MSLYVAQGLPTGIYNQALPAILRAQGVSLQVISLTSLLALPWALKMFWAPWVDHYHAPAMGRARSWILPLQAVCALLVAGVACFDPHALRSTSGLAVFFLMMFLLNLLAATQDIASDGLAVRSLAPGERALGNAVQVAGYRVGLIIGGGLLLYLLGSWTWRDAFLLVAGLLMLLTLPIALYREPAWKMREGRRHASSGYRETFRSFVAAPHFRRWAAVLLSYKVADGFGSAMVKPMLVDMGFNLKQLGLQVTILGSMATVTGAVLGGWLTTRWGRYPALLGFGAFQAAGMGAYGWLALSGDPVSPLTVYAINAVEHLASGLATVALLTIVMDHCRHAHAGTDFTLQVSLLAMTGGLGHLLAGVVADRVGYGGYFLMAMVAGLMLLVPVVQWGRGAAAGGRTV